jgi:hypothetical protein
VRPACVYRRKNDSLTAATTGRGSSARNPARSTKLGKGASHERRQDCREVHQRRSSRISTASVVFLGFQVGVVQFILQFNARSCSKTSSERIFLGAKLCNAGFTSSGVRMGSPSSPGLAVHSTAQAFVTAFAPMLSSAKSRRNHTPGGRAPPEQYGMP